MNNLRKIWRIFLCLVVGMMFEAQMIQADDRTKTENTYPILAEAPDNFASSTIPSTFELKWTSEVEEPYVTYNEDHSQITLTPIADNYETTTKGTSAKCVITFTQGGVVDAQPGEIEIRLPRYIFKNREDKWIGDFTIGISDEKSGDTGFYYQLDDKNNTDRSDDQIVLTNYQKIDSAYNFICDLTYFCNGVERDDIRNYPSKIKDGYTNSFKADLKVKLGDAEAITAETNKLDLAYKTDAKFDYLSKRYAGKFEQWQDSWGSAPGDYGDSSKYVYVSWSVASMAYGTQPYSVTINETPVNGKVLGWSLTQDLKDCVTNQDKEASYVDSSAVNAENSSSTTFYFLTAYPREGLKEGTILTNKVTGTLTGVDGASGLKDGKDTYIYEEYKFNYSGDLYQITKTDNGDDTLTPKGAGYLNKLEGTKEGEAAGVIYSTNKYDFVVTAKTRGWALTVPDGITDPKYSDYGVDHYTVEVTDEQVILNGETLDPEDYSFTTAFFNLQEYNCVQSSYNGNYYEDKDNNYAQWEPITLQYRIGKGNWTDLGQVTRDTSGYKLKYGNGSGTVTVGINNLVSLPQGTTQVRLVHNTKYYYCEMRLYLQISLNNTAHVRTLVKDLNSVEFNNVSSLRVLDEDQNWVNKKANGVSGSIEKNIQDYDSALYGEGIYSQHAIAEVTFSKLDVDSSINKKVEYSNSTANSLVTANYTVEEYSFVKGSMTYDEYKASGVLTEQRTGVFYDLLPSGMSVDEKTIQVKTYGAKKLCEHSVELVKDYKDSGRTMMIVKVTVPSEVENYYARYHIGRYDFCSGFTLTYSALYPWDMITDYGNSPENSVAFQQASYLSDKAYADDPSQVASFTDKAYFKDLNNDGNPEGSPLNTIYAQKKESFTFDTAAELVFSKKVKTDNDLNYSDTAKVVSGETYTYRLRTASAANFTTSNIIFYDYLEKYNPELTGRWQGKLVAIDTDYANSKGVKVVVYYSTQKELDIKKGSEDLKLDNSTIWTTKAPEDLSSVTALAFDLTTNKDGTPYILEEKEAINVAITLEAPTKDAQKYEADKALAYNSSFQSATTKNKTTGDTTEDVLESQFTKVSIRTPQLEIHKSSDPVSKTPEDPTKVNEADILTYDLEVINRETDINVKEVKISDLIPQGLAIAENKIEYYLGNDPTNAKKVIDSSNITLTKQQQDLTFTIKELAAGQTIHFRIPVTVLPTSKDLNYINSAKITSVGETRYSLTSETTYHYQKAPSPISDQITGSKILLEDDQNKEFVTGTFKVSIKQAQSNESSGYLFVNETVEVNQDGSFTFTPITFTQKGTYRFIVTEDDLEEDGYSYDPSIYQITYQVTNENGVLKLRKEITKDDETSEEISFTNTYKKPTPPKDQNVRPSLPGEVVSPSTGTRSNDLKWSVILMTSLTILITLTAVKKRKQS